MIRNTGRMIPLVRSSGEGQKLGQMVKDRQKDQGDAIGKRRGRSHQADSRSEENSLPYLNPMAALIWQGNGEYMSENVISNKTKRTVDRSCHALGNNWKIWTEGWIAGTGAGFL